MSFVPKTQPFSGKINAVTLGTGDKAIVIGGQNVLPFYTFDAPIENAPKIGVEITDTANEWTAPGLREFYAGCTTMADYAKKAETMEGADFLCLHFESADPNGANRSVEECVADAKAVAEAVSMPIVIMGCKNLEKDGELFSKIAEALIQHPFNMLLSADSFCDFFLGSRQKLRRYHYVIPFCEIFQRSAQILFTGAALVSDSCVKKIDA